MVAFFLYSLYNMITNINASSNPSSIQNNSFNNFQRYALKTEIAQQPISDSVPSSQVISLSKMSWQYSQS